MDQENIELPPPTRKRDTRIGLLRDEYQHSGASLIKRLEPVSGDLVHGSGSQDSEVGGFLLQDTFWLQATLLSCENVANAQGVPRDLAASFVVVTK